MIPERTLQSELAKTLNSAGWFVHKINDGSIGLKPADMFGSTPNGRAVLIEAKNNLAVKSDSKSMHVLRSRFSKHQVDNLKMLTLKNGYAIICGFNEIYGTSKIVCFLAILNKDSFDDEKYLRINCIFRYKRHKNMFCFTGAGYFNTETKELTPFDIVMSYPEFLFGHDPILVST